MMRLAKSLLLFSVITSLLSCGNKKEYAINNVGSGQVFRHEHGKDRPNVVVVDVGGELDGQAYLYAYPCREGRQKYMGKAILDKGSVRENNRWDFYEEGPVCVEYIPVTAKKGHLSLQVGVY
ncbi:hypothetical protein [Tellurirhabdus rosea]|uniref:hypothetical protein n=1 Tax=Tellurirhabdus rosea TaxID=2674997 RepID=UPI0022508446|nr:hypothetical protein [Tellurirhabdus rosea]